MSCSEYYQLAFDFHAPAEPSLSPCQASPTGLYQDLAGLGAREEHLGRFVRVANDEIIVRSPVDVAQYLLQHVYTPFETFDQEELCVLTPNTKNRITYETMGGRGPVAGVTRIVQGNNRESKSQWLIPVWRNRTAIVECTLDSACTDRFKRRVWCLGLDDRRAAPLPDSNPAT